MKMGKFMNVYLTEAGKSKCDFVFEGLFFALNKYNALDPQNCNDDNICPPYVICERGNVYDIENADNVLKIGTYKGELINDVEFMSIDTVCGEKYKIFPLGYATIYKFSGENNLRWLH